MCSEPMIGCAFILGSLYLPREGSKYTTEEIFDELEKDTVTMKKHV